MMRRLLLCFLGVLVSSHCFGQATTFKDAPNRKNIVIGYNRFTDRTIVITKRQVVSGVAGKRSLLDPGASRRIMEIAAFYSYTGKPSAATISEVVLVISPSAGTAGGSFIQKLDQRKWYIGADSEFNVIVDGERIPFGQIQKTFSYDVGGNYDDNAYVVIPLQKFRSMADAKKLEMAVGPIEIQNVDKFQGRMKELLFELDSIK
jgi:hypothetical protein